METTTLKNQYNPDKVFHPGETLADALDERGMSNKEFAVRAHKPEKTISNVLNGKSGITAEMALQFESVLDIPAHFWLNKQASYDEFIARRKQQKSIDAANDWARKFPYSAMAKLGWVPKTRKIEEKVIGLFDFFNIASKEAWESYFIDQKLKASFRISIKSAKCPYALSAWIAQGEREAARILVPPFNEKGLKKVLPELRAIMASEKDNFQYKMKEYLNDVGVKVTFVPQLPKAPVNGLSRWIGNHPVIQLTDRWKRYDIFWFSLFHEIGHVLLHKKKFISLEEVDYKGKDEKKEKEADEFAVRWTFSKKEEEEFWDRYPDPTEINVRKYAEEIDTHYSMIFGRFAKQKIISYYRVHELGLLKPIEFNLTENKI